jgi:hypothetical protein
MLPPPSGHEPGKSSLEEYDSFEDNTIASNLTREEIGVFTEAGLYVIAPHVSLFVSWPMIPCFITE